MYCSKCGKEVSNDTKFCSNCGEPLQNNELERDNSTLITEDIHSQVVEDSKKQNAVEIEKNKVETSDQKTTSQDVMRMVGIDPEHKVKSFFKINPRLNLFLRIVSPIIVFVLLAMANALYYVPGVNYLLYDVLGNQHMYMNLVDKKGVEYAETKEKPEKFLGKYMELNGYIINIDEKNEEGQQSFQVALINDLGGNFISSADYDIIYTTYVGTDENTFRMFDKVKLYGKIDGVTFNDNNDNGQQDENEAAVGPSIAAKYVLIRNSSLQSEENYKDAVQDKNVSYDELLASSNSYMSTPITFTGEIMEHMDLEDRALSLVATDGYRSGTGEMVYYDDNLLCIFDNTAEKFKEGNILTLYGTFEGVSTLDGVSYPVMVVRFAEMTGNSSTKEWAKTANASYGSGSLMNLSGWDLYLEMLGKTWTERQATNTFYFETDGLSAEDGDFYMNDEWIGSYSLCSHDASSFTLEVWVNGDNSDVANITIEAYNDSTVYVFDDYFGIDTLYDN